MIARNKKTPDADALLKRMASLCAKSEQCTFDIATKLYKAGLPKSESDEIISYLTANRYLDDARYARAFAGDKVRFSLWGKRKIRAALVSKRINSEFISAALDAVGEEEYIGALRRVITAKKRDADLSDREQRAKVYLQLLARGFESSLISRML